MNYAILFTVIVVLAIGVGLLYFRHNTKKTIEKWEAERTTDLSKKVEIKLLSPPEEDEEKTPRSLMDQFNDILKDDDDEEEETFDKFDSADIKVSHYTVKQKEPRKKKRKK